MLKTISKELIRFAIFSIIFIGIGSTIASQAPTNNQKSTDETGQPTELTSDFSTGNIISADTLNNMKIDWLNVFNKPNLITQENIQNYLPNNNSVVGGGWTRPNVDRKAWGGGCQSWGKGKCDGINFSCTEGTIFPPTHIMDVSQRTCVK